MANLNKTYKSLTIVLAIAVVALSVTLFWQLNKKQGITNEPNQQESGCEEFYDGTRACTSWYVGLSEAEAKSKAESDGLKSRVVEDNNNPNIFFHQDRQSKRVNFTIYNGEVTKAEFY
jgi:hypothetical protein